MIANTIAAFVLLLIGLGTIALEAKAIWSVLDAALGDGLWRRAAFWVFSALVIGSLVLGAIVTAKDQAGKTTAEAAR